MKLNRLQVAKYRNCAPMTNVTNISLGQTYFVPSYAIPPQKGNMQAQTDVTRPNKRSAASDKETRDHKKPKISVTSGVDLAE